MKPIRFAILGIGQIGKRHATIIDVHPECQLVALADVRPAKITGGDQWPVPYFPDLETLLQKGPAFDVLCICTPNGLHAQQALRALDARHHVVIEKPMGLRRADCEQVIHKSLNVSRQVFCVMQNRYSPPIRLLKGLIEEKKLGEIQLLQIHCFWNRDDRYYRLPDGSPHPWHGTATLDGGVLFTQFAHFIDILYWIFGDIDVIRTDLANFRHQHNTAFADSGHVLFRLHRGGLGNLSFSTATYDTNFESAITVLGERGTIKIGGQYMNEVTYCHVADFDRPALPPANPPNDYGPYQGSAANHHFVIQNVVDVLQGRQEVTTNALEGMKVVDIIERMYAKATVLRPAHH